MHTILSAAAACLLACCNHLICSYNKRDHRTALQAMQHQSMMPIIILYVTDSSRAVGPRSTRHMALSSLLYLMTQEWRGMYVSEAQPPLMLIQSKVNLHAGPPSTSSNRHTPKLQSYLTKARCLTTCHRALSPCHTQYLYPPITLSNYEPDPPILSCLPHHGALQSSHHYVTAHDL